MGGGGVPSTVSCLMAQLVALESSMKDDLGIDQHAQVNDSDMFLPAFDVAQLLLVPACFTLAWLCDGQSLDIGEPQPGLGLETPETSIVTNLLTAHNRQQLGDFPKRAMSSCWLWCPHISL